MERESKIAGVQLECAGVQVEHVKALFVKCVKGCGFYVHVSECAPRFVVKKNWRRRRKNMTMYDLFPFLVVEKKKLKQKLKI